MLGFKQLNQGECDARVRQAVVEKAEVGNKAGEFQILPAFLPRAPRAPILDYPFSIREKGQGAAATAMTQGSSLSSLLFYTHNVAKALKPSIDGELAHAIHETLHYALDGDPQDYTLPRSSTHPCSADEQEGQTSTSAVQDNKEADVDQIRPGFYETNEEERPYISYAWEEDLKLLVLPHPKTVANPILDPCTNPEDEVAARDAFDVTAKFFYLKKGQNNTYPGEWVDEAMSRFAVATGLDTVDTLILSFGDMKMAGSDGIETVAGLWKYLSPKENILSMGLSDFTQPTLESLIEKLRLGDCEPAAAASSHQSDVKTPKSSITSHVQQSLHNQDKGSASTDLPSPTHIHIPSSPSKAVFTELATDQDGAWKEYGPSTCRRPRLSTINLKEQPAIDSSTSVKSNGNGTTNASGSCCWDRSLSNYCKQNNILLVNHSDRRGEHVERDDTDPLLIRPILQTSYQLGHCQPS